MTVPAIRLHRAAQPGGKPQRPLESGEIALNEHDKIMFFSVPGSDEPYEFSYGSTTNGGAVSRAILAFNGYDLGSAVAGSSLNVDLSSDQIVVIDDIATLTDGWSVDLFFEGRPTAFQTAYLQFEAGAGQFEFRDALTDKFYILGGGEGFRLIKRGSVMALYCIKQPASVKIHKTKTNQAAYVAGSSAWTAMSLNAGSHVNFQDVAGGVTVPVSGEYDIRSRILAKWIVSGGDGYLKTKAGSETDLDRGIFSANTYKYLKTNLTANLEAGDVIKSEIYLTPSAQFYANNNILTIEFSGR